MTRSDDQPDGPESAEPPASRPDVVSDIDSDDEPAVSYPSHPDLDRALALVEVGDYANARDTLRRVIETGDAPDDVVAAAREVAARLKPDRFALGVLAVSALLVMVVAWLAFSHSAAH